ncbi:MAG: hypothetical protein WCT18_03075 [Patescibacteria group bacterium]
MPKTGKFCPSCGFLMEEKTAVYHCPNCGQSDPLTVEELREKIEKETKRARYSPVIPKMAEL